MRADDLPRHYHFFRGDRFARVPERLLLNNRFHGHELRGLDVADALVLLHKKAGMYRRPFDIEISEGNGTEWVEVALAARSNGLREKKYAYLARQRIGITTEMYFASTDQLLKFFDKRLARYVMGEWEALWIS